MEGHSLLLISIPGIVVASLQAGGQRQLDFQEECQAWSRVRKKIPWGR